MLKEDFTFIGIEMNEEKIMNTQKLVYKKETKCLIDQAAYKFFLGLKEKHKKPRVCNICYGKKNMTVTLEARTPSPSTNRATNSEYI